MKKNFLLILILIFQAVTIWLIVSHGPKDNAAHRQQSPSYLPQ
jgi:hypothetical protein